MLCHVYTLEQHSVSFSINGWLQISSETFDMFQSSLWVPSARNLSLWCWLCPRK